MEVSSLIKPNVVLDMVITSLWFFINVRTHRGHGQDGRRGRDIRDKMKPAQHARFASKNTQGSGKDFQVTTVSSSKFLSGGGRPLKRQARRDYPPISRNVKENLR